MKEARRFHNAGLHKVFRRTAFTGRPEQFPIGRPEKAVLRNHLPLTTQHSSRLHRTDNLPQAATSGVQSSLDRTDRAFELLVHFLQ